MSLCWGSCAKEWAYQHALDQENGWHSQCHLQWRGLFRLLRRCQGHRGTVVQPLKCRGIWPDVLSTSGKDQHPHLRPPAALYEETSSSVFWGNALVCCSVLRRSPITLTWQSSFEEGILILPGLARCLGLLVLLETVKGKKKSVMSF